MRYGLRGLHNRLDVKALSACHLFVGTVTHNSLRHLSNRYGVLARHIFSHELYGWRTGDSGHWHQFWNFIPVVQKFVF